MQLFLKMDLICIVSNDVYADHVFSLRPNLIACLKILLFKSKSERTDPWLIWIINSINEPVAELGQCAQNIMIVFEVNCLEFLLRFLRCPAFEMLYSPLVLAAPCLLPMWLGQSSHSFVLKSCGSAHFHYFRATEVILRKGKCTWEGGEINLTITFVRSGLNSGILLLWRT